MTRWQSKEEKLQARIGISNLNREIENLIAGGAGGFSVEVNEAKATLRNIEKLDTTTDKAGRIRIKRRIGEVGTYDYEMYKAIIYRENYLDSLKKYGSNFKNYQKFMNKLKTITNPLSFYRYIQQSNIMEDWFLWYNGNLGTLSYGEWSTDEEVFNAGLRQLGLIE